MQHVAAGFQPVGHEDGLQLGDDRPGDLVMIVAPMLRRIGVPHPFVRDASPADESGFAINNQQFAMCAMVVTEGIQPEDRMIIDGLDPRRPQARQIIPAHLVCPEGVENGIDLHAGPRAFRQRFGEFASDLPIREPVVLEINRMFGRANGAEHGRKNLRAIHQRRDVVAGDKIWPEQRAR